MVIKWNKKLKNLTAGEMFSYKNRAFLILDFIENANKVTVALFTEESSHPEHNSRLSIADYITIDATELLKSGDIPILDAFILLYSNET